ncbi:MAG: hypothetical protein AAGB93_06965 [Planctomycetota bacterium]
MSASRFVWNAMPSMFLTILAISALEDVISVIAVPSSSTSALPSPAAD